MLGRVGGYLSLHDIQEKDMKDEYERHNAYVRCSEWWTYLLDIAVTIIAMSDSAKRLGTCILLRPIVGCGRHVALALHILFKLLRLGDAI